MFKELLHNWHITFTTNNIKNDLLSFTIHQTFLNKNKVIKLYSKFKIEFKKKIPRIIDK